MGGRDNGEVLSLLHLSGGAQVAQWGLPRRSGKFGEIALITSSSLSSHLCQIVLHPPGQGGAAAGAARACMAGTDGYIDVDAEQLDLGKPVQEHQLCLASAGFVNLLQQVRRYLLQDSAIAHIPGPPDPAHDVFRHRLYPPFAKRLRFQV
jgi:hypothetical protein